MLFRHHFYLRLKVYRGYKNIVTTYVLRKCGINTSARSTATSDLEYSKVWRPQSISYLLNLHAAPQASFLYDRIVLSRYIDRRKFILAYIRHLLSSIQPKSVLELGSGDGVNLAALAIMYPEADKWHGIELTQAGVQKANQLLNDPPVDALAYVTGENKGDIVRKLKSSTIRFSQGDMTQLPFQDRSFDCVFSHHSIEQLPVRYPQAFREARRVTKRNAIFIEPFAEAQKNIFQRMYLVNQDYFRSSYTEVKKAGFKISSFTPVAFDKVKQNGGIVLSSCD